MQPRTTDLGNLEDPGAGRVFQVLCPIPSQLDYPTFDFLTRFEGEKTPSMAMQSDLHIQAADMSAFSVIDNVGLTRAVP